MYFKGAYLRVITPKTTNGTLPLILNGEVQNKEAFLPLTAKKQLEKKNVRLTKNGFGHLVSHIEVVGDETEVRRKNPKPASVNPKPKL